MVLKEYYDYIAGKLDIESRCGTSRIITMFLNRRHARNMNIENVVAIKYSADRERYSKLRR